MNYPSHYTSFLGGEVSPLFWNRCDMEKFSRWLATAENIRFHNIGAFYNRAGFERMGPTLFSERNPVIKLIPFVFNNNEVFEIEFTDGKFRVRKDGKVVVRSDGSEVSYDSPIKIESIQQLKYVQSGDIIFIASGTNPVYELRRLQEDGTEWEIKEFNTDILPVGEENEDKNKTINLAASKGVLSKTPYCTFPEPINGVYKPFNVVLTDAGGAEYSVTIPQLKSVSEISNYMNNNSTFLSLGLYSEAQDKILYFYKKPEGTISSVNFTIATALIDEWTDFQSPSYTKNGRDYWIIKDLSGDSKFPILVSLYGTSELFRMGDSTATPITQLDSKTVLERWDYSNPAQTTETLQEMFNPLISLETDNSIIFSALSYSSFWINSTIKVLYRKKTLFNFLHVFGESGTENYTHVLSGPIVKDLSHHDVFVVKNDVGTTAATKQVPIGSSWTTPSILTNGKWRAVTTGNWSGWATFEYSIDNQTTWIVFERAGGDIADHPININKSGEIVHDELLYIRASGTCTGTSGNESWNALTLSLYAENFSLNSYYKVISKIDENTAYVKCIKNDVGSVTNSYKWRLPVFSKKKGYPEAVGFYQNRLFFAKGYELWSSKINDFWDFYEPIELSKDDPINISLLSYRVNDIKSMMTTRSFFVFTTGGEFGIASEGPLSQDDKYLKQFSSHGINECNPILVGNIVLFVDSSGNTVRAFQYSFENDAYEANDMSVFIEQQLKGKQIVTTEYLKDNKECLFLDSDGIVWVFKFFPEQNIMSWSHWKHAKYRITNLCVSPHGSYEELYIVVSTPNGKFIEKLSDSSYADSVQTFTSEEDLTQVQTTFIEGDEVYINDGTYKYKATVGAGGVVEIRNPAKSVKVGLPYVSEATLLSPVISVKENGYTTYNRKKPFKAHFCFSNSNGFKVGIKEEEKMSIDFHLPSDPIENATNLTSGKKSVLIPSKYDGSAMVSFVQDKPYPMQIENVMLEVDYAGK